MRTGASILARMQECIQKCSGQTKPQTSPSGFLSPINFAAPCQSPLLAAAIKSLGETAAGQAFVHGLLGHCKHLSNSAFSCDLSKYNSSIFETKEFKLLFNLLEKAEQILSILNLSDSSISKYNTLKKLTYEILKLEFKPLEKKYISPSSNSNQNIVGNNPNINDEALYMLYFQNIKKSMLIDLILDYLVNINNSNEEPNLNYYLNSLTEIFNLSSDTVCSKSFNDISYDAKVEDTKMAELFTKVDQVFMNTFENLKQMKMNYENEIMELKRNCNREISDFKNNFENNRNFKPRMQNEKNSYFLEKIAHLVDESYERNKQIFPNENNKANIACKDGNFDEDIMKLEFISKVFDSYFNNNNKYLNDNNRNYGRNFTNNDGELINNILSSLPEIQKENDIFHKNFNDLMNYISTNIEGKVI